MFGVVIRSLESKLEESKKQCIEINISMQKNQETIGRKKLELEISWFEMNHPSVSTKLAEEINSLKKDLIVIEKMRDDKIDQILFLENSIKKYKDYIRVLSMKKSNISLDVLNNEEVTNYQAVQDELIIFPWLIADTEEEKLNIQVMSEQTEFNKIVNGPIDYENVRFSSSVVSEVKILKKVY